MDSKQQFETAFLKWSIDHPEICKALEADISPDLLRDIAAYFYHKGQIDATLDARTFLAAAFTEAQR